MGSSRFEEKGKGRVLDVRYIVTWIERELNGEMHEHIEYYETLDDARKYVNSDLITKSVVLTSVAIHEINQTFGINVII